MVGMMERTRAEHLAWCKQRALEYVDAGDLKNAVNSMTSDLNKHPETADYPAVLIQLVIMDIANNNVQGVRRWIEGFN